MTVEAKRWGMVAMGLLLPVPAAAQSAAGAAAPVAIEASPDSAAEHTEGSADSVEAPGRDPLDAWVDALRSDDADAAWRLVPVGVRNEMNLEAFRAYWVEERGALLDWALEWQAREATPHTWVVVDGIRVAVSREAGEWKIDDPSALHVPMSLAAAVEQLAQKWEYVARIESSGPYGSDEGARRAAWWSSWASALRRAAPVTEPSEGEWRWPTQGETAVEFRRSNQRWECVRAPEPPAAPPPLEAPTAEP